MSATVNLAKLIVQPPDQLTAAARDLLAKKVISGFTALEATLTDFEDDIRGLWTEFENLKTGETILGCKTKTEFCTVHLHRSRRAVNYMLAGGNPTNQTREIISRAKLVDPNAKPTECPHCGENYPSRNVFKKHLADKHSDVVNPTGFSCSVCGATFPTIADIRQHREIAHPAAPPAKPSELELPSPENLLPVKTPKRVKVTADHWEENQAARLKKLISEIEEPVPPNQAHLKLLAAALELLQKAETELAKVKTFESIEEYEALDRIQESMGKLDDTTNKITKATKNLNRHLAEVASCEVTKNKCNGARYWGGGPPSAGLDAQECLRHFKRFVARKGWICTGGYQFTRIAKDAV